MSFALVDALRHLVPKWAMVPSLKPQRDAAAP